MAMVMVDSQHDRLDPTEVLELAKQRMRAVQPVVNRWDGIAQFAARVREDDNFRATWEAAGRLNGDNA